MKLPISQKDTGTLLAEIEMIAGRCNHQKLALWAADCAERVLHLFSELNPEDHRPTLAIAAARSWVSGHMSVGEARKSAFAAHAAARESGSVISSAVARFCGHAAATAHVAGHAIQSAKYAAKAVKLANGDVAAEYFWQLKQLKS